MRNVAREIRIDARVPGDTTSTGRAKRNASTGNEMRNC
jgi:hypothetical protein